MHLANGTVSNEVCTIAAALSTAALIYAGNRVRTGATREQIAKAAIGAGVVFVAQMIDVPLFGGVGVHMIGAAFLTLLAGPALALLAMAGVIVVQALALNDGGITAMGANVLNMSVVAVGISAVVIRLARARMTGARGLFAGAAAAAAASVLCAVAAMSVELALSGTSLASAFALTMPAHASFAAWETVSTVVFVLLAAQARAIQPFAASPSSR